MTTKSQSTFGPFDEHGRFIHVIPDGPQCLHHFADIYGDKICCRACGIEVVSNGRGWVDALQPLAPSPWSPVAPTEPGLCWHSEGDPERDQKMTLVDWAYLGLNGPRGLCAFPQMESVSELGGFWCPLETPATPDLFAETLATGSEKLLQQCRVLRCGRFEETAAVIEGVVETLRAAYAKKGSK